MYFPLRRRDPTSNISNIYCFRNIWERPQPPQNSPKDYSQQSGTRPSLCGQKQKQKQRRSSGLLDPRDAFIILKFYGPIWGSTQLHTNYVHFSRAGLKVYIPLQRFNSQPHALKSFYEDIIRIFLQVRHKNVYRESLVKDILVASQSNSEAQRSKYKDHPQSICFQFSLDFPCNQQCYAILDSIYFKITE